MRFEDLPDLLTVEEAAALLRIGRTLAYVYARHYLATGGAEGLPVIRIGRQLRVSKRLLERIVNGELSLVVSDVSMANSDRVPLLERPHRRQRRSTGNGSLPPLGDPKASA